MENQKKNKPSNLVIISFALIVLVVVFYFILVMFFPEIFSVLNTGDVQPVTPNK